MIGQSRGNIGSYTSAIRPGQNGEDDDGDASDGGNHANSNRESGGVPVYVDREYANGALQAFRLGIVIRVQGNSVIVIGGEIVKRPGLKGESHHGDDEQKSDYDNEADTRER